MAVCCLFIYGCGANGNTGSKIDAQETSSMVNDKTANPTETNIDIEEDEINEYEDFGSNEYWKEVFQRQKEEIEFVVNWFKNIDYCDSLSFRNGEPVTSLDNDKTIKKIKAEKNYDKIKEYISKNDYDTRNNWFENEKNIILMHRFDTEELSGNFCLVYVGYNMKKSEERKRYYKKVDDNYYSKVIFYE